MSVDVTVVSPRQDFNIYLVAHTNVGKTTLWRTLTGSDEGIQEDRPDATLDEAPYELIELDGRSAIRLWDTPGLTDSFRLAARLRRRNRFLSWLVREGWDRFRNKKLWRYQVFADGLRQRADVILYVVNALEPPATAPHVDAELAALACVGIPVLVVLNQGANGEVANSRDDLVKNWTDHLAGKSVVRDVLNLDAFSRCWLQEIALFRAIGQCVAEARRAEYNTLVALLERDYLERFDRSLDAVARHLVRMAADREEFESGWSWRWPSLNPWRQPDKDTPSTRALEGLSRRITEHTLSLTKELIVINRLSGSPVGKIVAVTNELVTKTAPLDTTAIGITGGVISGLLGGLAADLMAGGLTLGTGALVGAALGAVGASALSSGYNVITAKGRGVVTWSPDSLVDAFKQAIVLYLAVAHFGRGQGEWKERELSRLSMDAVTWISGSYASPIRDLWPKERQHPADAHARAECLRLVRGAIREALLSIYPAEARLLPVTPSTPPSHHQVIIARSDSTARRPGLSSLK